MTALVLSLIIRRCFYPKERRRWQDYCVTFCVCLVLLAIFGIY